TDELVLRTEVEGAGAVAERKRTGDERRNGHRVGVGPVKGHRSGEVSEVAVLDVVTKSGTDVEGQAIVDFEALLESEFGVTVVVAFDVPEVGDGSFDEAEVTGQREVDFLPVVDREKQVVHVALRVVVVDVPDGGGGETEILGNFSVEIEFVLAAI